MNKLTLYLMVVLMTISSQSFASDDQNLCRTKNVSPYVDIKEDEGLHYPETWTGDPSKVNWDEEYGWGALETMWTRYDWEVYPQNNPYRSAGKVAGHIMPTAVYLADAYSPTGVAGWFRVVASGFLDTEGVYHQNLLFAPGKFNECSGCLDVQIGGPNEQWVISVTATGMGFVEDPSVPILNLQTNDGVESLYFRSPDGDVMLDVQNHNIKNVEYPFYQGTEPTWGYYWVRPFMASAGTISLGGVDYYAGGTGWEEREWDFSVPFLATQTEYHWSVRVDGCIDDFGRKRLCNLSGSTILGFDIRNADLTNVIHDWHEVGPPPSCEVTELGWGEWDIVPLETWVSPYTGYTYATKVRVTAPSRDTDLVFTVEYPHQEMFLTAYLWAGWYEPAVKMEGTYRGKKIFGEASHEEFNGRTNRELGIPIPSR